MIGFKLTSKINHHQSTIINRSAQRQQRLDVPQVNYPPQLWEIITAHLAHLAQLTTNRLTLPYGSGRPLRLRLTRKEQISVSIVDTQEY